MSEYKSYTTEQIEQAKNADIVSFLHSQGYILKQQGNNPNQLKVSGQGGLLVTVDQNVWAWTSRPPCAEQLTNNPSAKCLGGRGALEFCKRALNMSWKEAMLLLVGEGAEIKQFENKNLNFKPQEKVKFKMPEKSDNHKKVYAYLINQRMLAPQTISDFIKQGVLYQGFTEFRKQDGSVSKHENAIFLHRNEKGVPCGADVQGIYSEARFKGIIAPDETDRGFVYTKGDISKADTVYLFEAPIDLMSYVELHPEIENAQFVAMGGLKPTIAEHYIDSGKSVVSCVDNDAAGQAFNNRILKEKMKDSLSTQGGTDVEHKSCKEREPPIEFLNADVNGQKASFFISRSDYEDAKQAGAAIEKSAFVWVNRSNFTVNRECAEAGVKDFNDLLKSGKGFDKEIAEQSKEFGRKINEICDWCDQTQETINRQRAEREETANRSK